MPVSQEGLSLLEVLIAAAILTIMAFGIIQNVGTLEIESKRSRSRLMASLLASDLREEILSKPPLDPDQPPIFGKEPGEYGAVRVYFDDRDDYDGLEDTPVTDLKGAPIPGMEKFSRQVRIRRVAEDDFNLEDRSGGSRMMLYTLVVSEGGVESSKLEWLEFRP